MTDNDNNSKKEEQKKSESKYINNIHDKVIRDTLMDKEEGAVFINKALNLKEKLRGQDLEHYTNSYVNNKLENRISDVVYKIVKKEIYVIIEHQTKKDVKMIFEYKVEILRLALKEEKEGTYEEPKVIGIVLYTGSKNWETNKDKENQNKKVAIEEYKQGLTEYKLIEAKKLSKGGLIKEDSILSKIILLEQVESVKEIEEIYKTIKEQFNDTMAKKIERYIIILMLQSLKIERKEIEEMIKEEEGHKMHLQEVFEREFAKTRREGRAQGLAEGRMEGRIEGREEGKIEGISLGEARGETKGIKIGEARGEAKGKKRVCTIAQKLLKKGMLKEEVIEITGLTSKEIDKEEKQIATA